MYYVVSNKHDIVYSRNKYEKACEFAAHLSLKYECKTRVYRLQVIEGKLVPCEEAQYDNGL